MLEKPDSLADTIVACATPPGEGAIAIIRISGPDALKIASQMAPTKKPRVSHKMYLADIRAQDGQVPDSGLVVEMHGPRSYTGDNTVEYNLHGSRAVIQSVTDAAVAFGGRLARPGEFTLRAYLNGRLTLAQAEAVGDLIASRSTEQQSLAVAQLKGSLSDRIKTLHLQLEAILADWRAVFDFPEYEVGEGVTDSSIKSLKSVLDSLDRLISGARVDLYRGQKVVICGATNAGKSTLLNALAGEERVLVDSQPGTTRDPVDIEILQGMSRLTVCDTAGFRQDAEGLERRGIELSEKRINEADLALWLLDPKQPTWPPKDLRVELILSKLDLASKKEILELESQAELRNLQIRAKICAKDGKGIKELVEQLTDREFSATTSPTKSESATETGGVTVVRKRHLTALQLAEGKLQSVLAMHEASATMDILAFELEEALRHLASILGRDVDNDLIDRIFSDFCIGK